MITYSEYEQTAIEVALTAIQQTLVTDNVLSSVVQVENYLKLQLADEPDEWFGVMFLTSQHERSSRYIGAQSSQWHGGA